MWASARPTRRQPPESEAFLCVAAAAAPVRRLSRRALIFPNFPMRHAMAFVTVPEGRSYPVSSPSAQRLARFQRHLTLWVLQSWISMFYIAAGYAKLTEPQELLSVLMTWPGQFDIGWVRLAGWTELSLAILLLTPLLSWTWFRVPMLAASTALLAISSVMTIYHGLALDVGLSLVNGALLATCLSVILGRWPRTETERHADVLDVGR